MPEFPRYFAHTVKQTSDALYVRHDDACRDAVVVTARGERAPNADQWKLEHSLLMVSMGRAMEITKEQAAAIVALADDN